MEKGVDGGWLQSAVLLTGLSLRRAPTEVEFSLIKPKPEGDFCGLTSRLNLLKAFSEKKKGITYDKALMNANAHFFFLLS